MDCVGRRSNKRKGGMFSHQHGFSQTDCVGDRSQQKKKRTGRESKWGGSLFRKRGGMLAGRGVIVEEIGPAKGGTKGSATLASKAN